MRPQGKSLNLQGGLAIHSHACPSPAEFKAGDSTQLLPYLKLLDTNVPKLHEQGCDCDQEWGAGDDGGADCCGTGFDKVVCGMKALAREILRLIECVGLGLWLALMTPVLAGGIYEIVTGSPSDGFLFMLMIYGFPLFAAVLLIVPVGCWKSKKCLNIARWGALFFLVTLVAIRLMRL